MKAEHSSSNDLHGSMDALHAEIVDILTDFLHFLDLRLALSRYSWGSSLLFRLSRVAGVCV